MRILFWSLASLVLFFAFYNPSNAAMTKRNLAPAEGYAKIDADAGTETTMVVVITGVPAHRIYDFLKYGTSTPATVKREAPQPIEKNGFRCAWDVDRQEYSCRHRIAREEKNP